MDSEDEQEVSTSYKLPPYLRLYEEEQNPIPVWMYPGLFHDSREWVLRRFFASIKGFHQVSSHRVLFVDLHNN
jgi:hypothetical protein